MIWRKTMKRFSVFENEPEEEDDGPELEDVLQEGGGGPPKPRAIAADALPEELRDLPEAEIKFHLSQLVQGVRTSNQKVRTLEDQLRQLQTSIPPKPRDPEKPKKPLEERILDDPEEVILEVLEKRGLTSRFERLEGQVGESAFALVAARVDGFEDHEADVREILDRAGTPKTVDHILGALDMVVGRKTREGKLRETRKRQNTEIPKGDPPKKKGSLPPLDGLELEIFSASGMSREDWEKNKKGGFDIPIKTS